MALTWRDIKIRYKQTIMGFLWAILMPIMVVISGVIVKKAMAILAGRPLLASEITSITVKALPWAFFVGSLKFAVNSLTGHMNLVTKIYFPREVFPIASVLTQLVDFVIAACALAVILAFLKIGITIHFLWLPVLIAFLVLFTTAMAFILSCGNLFFRDVKYITDIALTFGIFFTPVFYDAALFGKWKTALLLNPVGAILENINTVVVLHQAPDYLWLAYSGICAVGGLILAWYAFHKAEPSFAENI